MTNRTLEGSELDYHESAGLCLRIMVTVMVIVNSSYVKSICLCYNGLWHAASHQVVASLRYEASHALCDGWEVAGDTSFPARESRTLASCKYHTRGRMRAHMSR